MIEPLGSRLTALRISFISADAIAAVMHLREDLRDYVLRLNALSVATGVPMMRPMVFQYPSDPVCVNSSAEAQFTLGDDWLVAPVTASGATTWPAYLPEVGPTHTWVYWWNQTAVKGGQWVNVDTSSISDFPLFYRRPIATATNSDGRRAEV